MNRLVRIALAAAVALGGLVAWTGPASAATVTPAAQENWVSATAGVYPTYLGGIVRHKTDWGDVRFTPVSYKNNDGLLCMYLTYADDTPIPGSPLRCAGVGETADWGILFPTSFKLWATDAEGGNFTGYFYY